MNHIRNRGRIPERNITTATEADVDQLTTQAIQKAQSLITLASMLPSENVPRLEEALKSSFINALLVQQKNNSHELKIYDKQRLFDSKI